MKGKSKKTFRKGDQCVQNASTRKFRSEVNHHVISRRKSGGGLTHAALEKHNEDIDDLLEMKGLALSETTASTKKSKAFTISGLTDCSNMTFNRVLDKWNSSNTLDQEKCAILAAVTEVIRSKGGSESETDYFLALMSLLESSAKEEDSCTAILYLLSLVVKKVPDSVLRTKCSECLKSLVELLNIHHDNGRASLLMAVVQCLSSVLTAQEPSVWNESSTQHSFQMLLSFIIHSKPKVRKVAQTCIQTLLKLNLANHKNHQAGSIASKFMMKVLKQFTPETASTCHHVLNMMKNTLHNFKESNLKELCEASLQLLSVNNPIMKANVMQTLHSMFAANPPEENMTTDLNGKLIAALYDFQPSYNDVHVAEAWLSVVVEAHSNLSLLNDEVCLKYLPKFFGTVLNFFMSEHRDVVQAAANVMRVASEKCMEPYLETLQNDISKGERASSFVKIFNLIEGGLRYKFQPVWDVVLQSLQYLYLTYGKLFPSVMLNSVCSLIDMHSSPDFPFRSHLDKAVGAAFTSIGPKLILEKRPLDLISESNDCQFPRGWLLPVMKDNVRETKLEYFVKEMLPMAAHLREKGLHCRKNKQDLEAKVFETLQFQVWSLLPGFCTKPTDISLFKDMAKILGTALMEESALRPLVLQALRTLINTTSNDEMSSISQFSKNYVPILFNLYTTEDEECQPISLAVLEAIKTFLLITDIKLIVLFIGKSLEKLSQEKKMSQKHKLMDLIVCMVRYSNEEQIKTMYGLVLEHIKNKDKKMQKKAYRILEEICDANSQLCKELIREKFDEIKTMLVDSLSAAVPSAKAPRMRCLSYLIKNLERDQRSFLESIIPEVILCTKEVGLKTKSAAFDLIRDIGTAFIFLSDKPKEECIEEYFTLVMAGLAGSPHMISTTLLAFTKMLFEYKDCMKEKLVGSLFEAAILLLKSKTSEVVKASLIFVRALIKILDANELTSHLEQLIKNLFSWRSTNSNNKSLHRQQVRIILERLDKKCGYELVRSLVPEAHRRFIIQIHKQMERTKRKKEAARENKEEESLEKSETTWEDILADSADEGETEDKGRHGKKKGRAKKRKEDKEKSQTWIMEGEEAVDLMDPSIARNIVGTRPKLQAKRKTQTGDDFKISDDGKLIIKEPEEETDGKLENTEKLDIGDKELLGGFERAPKQMKLGKRKRMEEMPGDDERPSYQPGGQGIHRKRDDEDEPILKRKHGEEYKSKRAGGDVKIKGKPDPYAYIPMDRKKLNKRKRAKLAGQFNSVVKATKRASSKSKQHKKHKK